MNNQQLAIVGAVAIGAVYLMKMRAPVRDDALVTKLTSSAGGANVGTVRTVEPVGAVGDAAIGGRVNDGTFYDGNSFTRDPSVASPQFPSIVKVALPDVSIGVPPPASFQAVSGAASTPTLRREALMLDQLSP